MKFSELLEMLREMAAKINSADIVYEPAICTIFHLICQLFNVVAYKLKCNKIVAFKNNWYISGS